MAISGQEFELLSRSVQPSALGSGDSTGVELSADGQWAMFLSTADNLVEGDENQLYLDIFLKNLQTGELSLVSRRTNGTGGGNGNSAYGAFSSNGEYVVFASDASDLVTGDTNEVADIFLWERASGAVTLVSRTSEGLSNGESGLPSISGDGGLILFESAATNLVANDTNGSVDVFLYERETGVIELVTANVDDSASAKGRFAETIVGNQLPVLSPDGRYVAFVSGATNLVSFQVSDAHHHVYVRDISTGTTALASDGTNFVARAMTEPVFAGNNTLFFAVEAFRTSNTRRMFAYDPQNATNWALPLPGGTLQTMSGPDSPAPSSDGQFLAYQLNDQIYLWDAELETNVLVSAASSGDPGAGPSQRPLMTVDGSHIFFLSAATNLQALPTHELFQLYKYDRATRSIELVTTDSTGTSGLQTEILYPSISGDGTMVGFELHDSELVEGDDNNAYDVFVWTPEGVEALSVGEPGTGSLSGNGASKLAANALSWDGRLLVFASSANDLVLNDSNEAEDIFVRDLKTGTTTLVSVDAEGGQGNERSFAPVISANGKFVAFLSYATNLVANDTNKTLDIFLKDLQSGAVSRLNSGTIMIPINQPPAISVDGQVVAYQATGNGTPGSSSTIFVHPGGGPVMQMPLVSTEAWALRGDGGMLAGGTTTGIKFMSVPDGQASVATLGRPGSPLAFSEDGTMLLVVLQTPPHPVAVGVLEIVSGQITETFTNSFSGVLSPNGKYLAHEVVLAEGSLSNSMVYEFNVFNFTTETNHLITSSTLPTQMLTKPVTFSRDGRWLAFSTRSSNVLAADQNGMGDTYVFDAATRQVTLMSSPGGAGPGNGPSVVPIISRRGDFMVFQSSASDLLEGDKNLQSDIYLARLSQSDSDEDGLDDGYEVIYFGSYKQTGDEDADGDGMSNAAEIAAGTDPTDADSVLSLNVTETEGGFVVSFPAVRGEAYQLQVKNDVDAGWVSEGNLVIATSETVEFLVEGADEQQFFRLQFVR